MPERLRLTYGELDVREDHLLSGHAELDRVARCEPQLVDSVHVGRIGDRDEQRVVAQRVRNRRHAFEHVQRNEARGLLVDAGDRELDERQSMSRCEQPGESVPRGEAFVE